MECKNCGGKILFQNGIGCCQSCGAKIALNSIYEKVDVFICYVECDAFRRRTKDSIIAHEVYRKLEESKISTFYERISADGFMGDDLEQIRLSAINQSKIILILGSSKENFAALEKKYLELFDGKTVIPFCIDINPAEIPKTLSKIQALNYTTIGWEKGLVNGVYNLLGRKNEIDSVSVYAATRKRRFLAIGIVIALLFAIAVVALHCVFDQYGENGDSKFSSQAEEIKETESSQPTQKELYEQATDLMNQEKLGEALALFHQIPQHQNSANMIKQIYAKYEGYYKNEEIGIHLEIQDNIRADVEISILSASSLVKIVESAEVSIDTIAFDYLDNHQNAGKIELKLTNSGLQLTMSAESMGSNIEAFFPFSEKSDMAFVQMDKKILLEWLDSRVTYSEIIGWGYELEEVTFLNRTGDNRLYKLKDTDIYLSMFEYYICGNMETPIETTDRVLLGISAPAELIAPSRIGQKCQPFLEEDIICWPQMVISGDMLGFWKYFESTENEISSKTQIGVFTKANLAELADEKDNGWDWATREAYLEIEKNMA